MSVRVELPVEVNMHKAGWGWRRSRWDLIGFIALLFLTASISQAAPQAQATAADYVGADTCSACHAEQFEQFRKTYMAAVLAEKYPVEQQGCEACHGPGRAHVEAIGEATDDASMERAKSLIYSFARHSPKENADRCLTCHIKNENQSLFRRSRHLGSGVFCGDCHTAHLPKEVQSAAQTSTALASLFSVPKRAAEQVWLDDHLLKEEQPKLCYSCHRNVEAEFQLPVHHRVQEGLLKCTDCHNPHGSVTANELRSVRTEACYACHVEKRGPFVFEHAAVQVEGCTGCHVPHGSTNAFRLKRRQERQLCLECHTAPEGLNVPHPRLGFQEAGECSRCHVEIHGSNYQKQFLR
ncbi:MAG: cytochrome c3 family protein [Acidobacteria bacterium]|nr:cytochrome c3 family protein [Acidobacteriota bacterium]